MKLRLELILILLLFSTFSFGQKAIIEGRSIDYSGELIAVNQIINPITRNTYTLDTISIDTHGRFSTELSVDELSWIQMDLGVYRCVLLIMPGHKYKIALPPRRDKTEAEIRSPFFESMIIHLRVLQDQIMDENYTLVKNSDINTQIFSFDTLLFRINADQLIARNEKRSFPIDSLILSIESSYKNDTSTYFFNYRKYRYGLIQMNSGNKSLKKIYDNYLSVEYPELHNPAYLDLFNKMYEKFFYYFSRTEEGKDLNRVINLENSLSSLRREINKHNSIPNDTIADLVILKEVNESFYRNYYYKEALLLILDSLKASPSLPTYSMFASDIHEKLTKLMIGTLAPNFSLLNQFNERVSLEDLRGKYVYLMFCTPDNYACLKEYPFLKALNKKHHDYLQITTIMVTDSLTNMQKFMASNRYSWRSLFYENNEELLHSYDIRAYPTCYLIGPDGLLIQSPATLPTEGFEQQLFRIMRSRGDL